MTKENFDDIQETKTDQQLDDNNLKVDGKMGMKARKGENNNLNEVDVTKTGNLTIGLVNLHDIQAQVNMGQVQLMNLNNLNL